jgi:hypothetical protein
LACGSTTESHLQVFAAAAPLGFGFLRQGVTTELRLDSNSRSSCLYLPYNAGIIGSPCQTDAFLELILCKTYLLKRRLNHLHQTGNWLHFQKKFKVIAKVNTREVRVLIQPSPSQL